MRGLQRGRRGGELLDGGLGDIAMVEEGEDEDQLAWNEWEVLILVV